MEELEIAEEVSEYLEIGFFLAIAVLLAFGSLQTAGTVMNTERPVVSVVSCSMYPELNVGDILLVQGTEFEDIREGDIAVYNVADQAILNIEGQEIQLNSEDTTKTVNGREIKLIDAGSAEDGYAIVNFQGENIQLLQGEGRSIDGVQIDLEYAAGMEIPVVHRVTEKHGDHLETKGDNNPRQIRFEKHVEAEQIYGVSRFRIPRIGGLKLLLMDFMGINGGKPVVFDTFPVCQEN
ncbi:MAG: signal peptidase I [Nanohaloarchaea archaeon SW_7_46_7]|nr:MAG: signal peptidase I [Nanohaloarchaea archaeon SW_7_46_7]